MCRSAAIISLVPQRLLDNLLGSKAVPIVRKLLRSEGCCLVGGHALQMVVQVCLILLRISSVEGPQLLVRIAFVQGVNVALEGR